MNPKYKFSIIPCVGYDDDDQPVINYDLAVCDLSSPLNPNEKIGCNFSSQREASDYAGVWLEAENSPVITFSEFDLRRS